MNCYIIKKYHENQVFYYNAEMNSFVRYITISTEYFKLKDAKKMMKILIENDKAIEKKTNYYEIIKLYMV